MKKEDELSALLKDGKLIELCNEAKNTDFWVINKWYEQEETRYISSFIGHRLRKKYQSCYRFYII